MSNATDTLKRMARFLPSQHKQRRREPTNPNQEYSVDELARVGETTVRNIRAYQDKDLLPSPSLRGRKGIYDNRHLSRLRVITGLLDRGYTLTSIKDLLAAIENGVGLRELLGIESAITGPWSNEDPKLIPKTQLNDLFGKALTEDAIKKAFKLELIRDEGQHIHVRSMKTLEAIAELVRLGVALDDILDIFRLIQGNLQRIANEVVKLASESIIEHYGRSGIPPNKSVPEIAELIWGLRPLTEIAIRAELARAMEKAGNQFLTDKLELIMSRLHPE